MRTSPIATLSSCFFRYVRGSWPAASRPGSVADQTSRVPIAVSPSTTTTRIQSMCRSGEFLAKARASRERGRRAANAPGRGVVRPRGL
jgi:hypothetical protein